MGLAMARPEEGRGRSIEGGGWSAEDEMSVEPRSGTGILSGNAWKSMIRRTQNVMKGFFISAERYFWTGVSLVGNFFHLQEDFIHLE